MLDIQKIASQGVARSLSIFLQDLQALPEDAFCRSFGPTTRTVADIVYEVIMVNDHVGMIIRGEKPFVWPEGDFIRAPQEFCTKEIVIGGFEQSAAKIRTTVEALSGGELEEPIQTEDGETNRFERCRFITLHLWYHSGQLNFIQTLLGDADWHWQ